MAADLRLQLRRLLSGDKDNKVMAEIYPGCVIFNYKVRGKRRSLDIHIDDAKRLAKLILAEVEQL